MTVLVPIRRPRIFFRGTASVNLPQRSDMHPSSLEKDGHIRRHCSDHFTAFLLHFHRDFWVQGSWKSCRSSGARAFTRTCICIRGKSQEGLDTSKPTRTNPPKCIIANALPMLCQCSANALPMLCQCLNAAALLRRCSGQASLSHCALSLMH